MKRQPDEELSDAELERRAIALLQSVFPDKQVRLAPRRVRWRARLWVQYRQLLHHTGLHTYVGATEFDGERGMQRFVGDVCMFCPR